MDCPTCDDTGFDSINSLAGHHGAAHGEPLPQPEDVEIPEDENWSDLTPRQRWYYRNREEIMDEKSDYRMKKREELKSWLQDYKDDLECKHCDEDRNPALDFHHTDESEKKSSISTMVHNVSSKETVIEEIEKCEVICANCHRVHHAE